MIGTTAAEALWLLIPALPIAIYVAWGDLAHMKITNKSVLVMGGAFILVGLFVFPFELYVWRLAHIAVLFAIGSAAFAGGLVGGGDAKYTAAIAPYFAASDLRLILVLFSAMLLAAFVTHRLFGRIPLVRTFTADWKSWSAGDVENGKKFPMGLALSGTLIAYLFWALASG